MLPNSNPGDVPKADVELEPKQKPVEAFKVGLECVVPNGVGALFDIGENAAEDTEISCFGLLNDLGCKK